MLHANRRRVSHDTAVIIDDAIGRMLAAVADVACLLREHGRDEPAKVDRVRVDLLKNVITVDEETFAVSETQAQVVAILHKSAPGFVSARMAEETGQSFGHFARILDGLPMQIRKFIEKKKGMGSRLTSK
jgi:hypothetical protein